MLKPGKPMAKLVPLLRAPSHRKLGMFKGKLNVPDDFDAPLSDEVVELFESSVIEPPSENR